MRGGVESCVISALNIGIADGHTLETRIEPALTLPAVR